jgi:hypothetical protein
LLARARKRPLAVGGHRTATVSSTGSAVCRSRSPTGDASDWAGLLQREPAHFLSPGARVLGLSRTGPFAPYCAGPFSNKEFSVSFLLLSGNKNALEIVWVIKCTPKIVK